MGTRHPPYPEMAMWACTGQGSKSTVAVWRVDMGLSTGRGAALFSGVKVESGVNSNSRNQRWVSEF